MKRFILILLSCLLILSCTPSVGSTKEPDVEEPTPTPVVDPIEEPTPVPTPVVEEPIEEETHQKYIAENPFKGNYHGMYNKSTTMEMTDDFFKWHHSKDIGLTDVVAEIKAIVEIEPEYANLFEVIPKGFSGLWYYYLSDGEHNYYAAITNSSSGILYLFEPAETTDFRPRSDLWKLSPTSQYINCDDTIRLVL